MIYGIVAADDVTPLPPDIDYTTSGVNFNGSTYLRRGAALTGFGTPSKFTWSVWTKISSADDGLFNDLNQFYQGTTADGPNAYFNMAFSSDSYFDTSPTGGPGSTITSASWQGITCSVDMDTQTAHIYRGNTDILAHDNVSWGGSTIAPGSDFYFGQDGFDVKITGDVADFRLWVGQYVDITQVASRRLFIRSNGKPCDPSLANDALGTPIVSFIGNSSSFATNGGSGGSFSTTGSLSTSSTSPTD